MVNYKLCINDKVVNLNMLGLKDSNRLESIDMFTTNFENPEELILFLTHKGVISNSNNNNNNIKINIQYNFYGKKRIPVLYKSQRHYLDLDVVQIYRLQSGAVYDIDLPIYNEFMSLMYDDKFLKEVRNYFSRFPQQQMNCSDLHHYLNDKKYNGVDSKTSDISDILNSIFLNVASCKIDSNGEIKINYKALRELGIFISKYKSKKIKENLDDYDSSVVFENGEYKTKYYKQLSLFKK